MKYSISIFSFPYSLMFVKMPLKAKVDFPWRVWSYAAAYIRTCFCHTNAAAAGYLIVIVRDENPLQRMWWGKTYIRKKAYSANIEHTTPPCNVFMKLHVLRCTWIINTLQTQHKPLHFYSIPIYQECSTKSSFSFPVIHYWYFSNIVRLLEPYSFSIYESNWNGSLRSFTPLFTMMRWNQVRTTYNGPLEQARLATNLFYWTNHLLHFNLLKEIA